MEYTKMFKVITTFLLIACVFTQTFAAPLNQPRNQNTRSDRHLSRKMQDRRLERKNMDGKKFPPAFKKNDDLLWQNSCLGTYDPTPRNKPAITAEYFRNMTVNLNITVYKTMSDISNMHKISTHEIVQWSKWNETYRFLPTKPTYKVQKWHNDTQIFLAGFILLNRLQEKINIAENTKGPMSKELEDITVLAKNLLCEIESFMNDTSVEHRPVFISRHKMNQMMSKLRSTTHLDIADRMFLKVRFIDYVNLMYKRLQDLKMNHMHMETKNGGRKHMKMGHPTKKGMKHHKKIIVEQLDNSIDMPMKKPGMGNKQRPGMGNKKPGLGNKKNRINKQNEQNQFFDRPNKMRLTRTTKIIKQ